jgi:hypothetical protein
MVPGAKPVPLALSVLLLLACCGAAAEETTLPAADAPALAHMREQARKWIRLLAGPGWRKAEAELVKMGEVAVPLLIEALAPACDQPAYAVRAPGKATRPVSLSEVAYRVLCNLLQNHSTYQGALPALDRKAWEEFWAREGPGIQFGKQ